MLIQPNETLLQGEVLAVEPSPGGAGYEIRFRVAANQTPNARTDFLRSKPGAELTLYSADRPRLSPGDVCRVTTALLGGPTGQRIILKSHSSL